MPKTYFSLHLTVPIGAEAELARALRAQLLPDQWQSIRQLALEVTLVGEQEAAGTRMVVIPLREGGVEATVREAERTLGLRATGLPD